MNLSKDLERIYIESLLTDTDVAMTLLDLAEMSETIENARQNYESAEKAYDHVIAKLPNVNLTAEVEALFERRLAVLRWRLSANRRFA